MRAACRLIQNAFTAAAVVLPSHSVCASDLPSEDPTWVNAAAAAAADVAFATVDEINNNPADGQSSEVGKGRWVGRGLRMGRRRGWTEGGWKYEKVRVSRVTRAATNTIFPVHATHRLFYRGFILKLMQMT